MPSESAHGQNTRDADRWPADFTRRRALEGNPNQFFLNNRHRRSWFNMFFKHSSVSTLDFKTLQKQFRGFDLQHLIHERRGEGTRMAAWIDERQFSDTGEPALVRTKGNGNLTAKDLWTRLQVPRFGVPNVSDADRRLIFITDPDPAYILALAVTASHHQGDALRSAIYEHTSRESSLSVHLKLKGFSTFHLTISIPFFVVRAVCLKDSSASNDFIGLPRNSWRLCRPNTQDSGFDEEKELIIEESQFSLALCGYDDYRWCAYAFVSSNAEENDEEDAESEDDADQEGGGNGGGTNDEDDNDDEEEDESSFTCDPISSDALDAEYIRNPREYYLDVLNIRLLKCLNCFKDAVKELEYSIKDHQNQDRAVGNLEKQDYHSIRFQGTVVNFGHIVAKFLQTTKKTLVAWERFSKRDRLIISDLSSFPEHSRSKIAGTLNSISKTFEKFEDLHSVLRELDRTCSRDAKNEQARRARLNLTLTMNNVEVTKHNASTASFTLFGVFPLTIVPPIFSMNRSVGPLKLSVGSFLLCYLVIMVAVGLTYLLFNWIRAGWQKTLKWRNQTAQNGTSTGQRLGMESDSIGQTISSTGIAKSRSLSWGVLDVSKIRRRIPWGGKGDTDPESMELEDV